MDKAYCYGTNIQTKTLRPTKNEYESYILIDFNEASDEVKSLFNNLMNSSRTKPR